MRPDHAHAAGDLCAAAADVGFAGHVVKVDPAAVGRRHDALGAQHDAVAVLVDERVERGADLVVGVFARRLGAPAREHLVRVVVMVVMAAAVVMVMLVMLVVMLVVVMMMLVLVFIVIIVVMVMVMAAAAFVLVIIVMVVMVLVLVLVVLLGGLGLEVFELGGQRVAPLHRLEDLLAVELRPRRGHDRGGRVLLAQQRHSGVELLGTDALGAREDDGARVLDLVVEKLAEVLHVHLAFVRVHDGREAVEHQLVGLYALHGADDVAQLADARRLDEDAVGVKLREHFLQRVGKVAHEAAADAAGVHFVNLHAGVLEEAAVDGDLTELIFDQHDLFARVGLGDQLFDQRGLAGTEKAGENINFCHKRKHFLSGSTRSRNFVHYYSTKL